MQARPTDPPHPDHHIRLGWICHIFPQPLGLKSCIFRVSVPWFPYKVLIFCLRRASQISPPDVDENTAYSNIQKINQFARYVWIACLRVNEDEDWLDAVLALATLFERLCDGTIFARCGPS